MKLFFFSFVLMTLTLHAAEPKSLRWTGKEDKNSDPHHLLEVIRAKTGIALSTDSLMLIEERTLATSHFLMLAQKKAGLPVRGRVLRVWTHPRNGETIQVEAQVEDFTPLDDGELAQVSRAKTLSSQATMSLVRQEITKLGEDNSIRSADWKDVWEGSQIVRHVTVKGRRGKHLVRISVTGPAVLSAEFTEYPEVDPTDEKEFSIPIKVYPIYEEPEGKSGASALLPRITSELKYLSRNVVRVDQDPYTLLKTQRYDYALYDPFLGLTVEGRKKGFWAMSFVKEQARSIYNALPRTVNDYANGIILQGRYATVSIDPLVPAKFEHLQFTPKHSGQFYPLYQTMPEDPEKEEMVPTTALRGRPITSTDDAWNRPARRLPDHDPASYLNDGFDELQVYWAITQTFDSLRGMGFTDPELSVRPFHAFLYNPDISMRDNAFYTDDTINFTTYSAKNANYARDNTTIWHELGHGVMDRLMGDYLTFNDTGGLQEGMADFVAQMVINDVTGGLPFEGKDSLRIFNQTAFHLTNEVHDDGEAYGGAMNDLLVAAMNQMGREGLVKTTDLTLEAMRLTRNHPSLTANDWFEHMLFADELGSRVRKPGELKTLIVSSLGGRNFVFDNTPVAEFSFKHGADEVTSKSPGSRNNPIRVKLKEMETSKHTLNVSLKSSAVYSFKYPVAVKVDLQTGPLQGAIHWEQEGTNPLTFTLQSEKDMVSIPLSVTGKCDEINRPDNSCVDYAYVQIWNKGETAKPQAKKRFYLRVYPQP